MFPIGNDMLELKINLSYHLVKMEVQWQMTVHNGDIFSILILAKSI